MPVLVDTYACPPAPAGYGKANEGSGPHPGRALVLLDRLGLYHAIFTDPAQPSLSQPAVDRWHVAYTCLDHVLRNHSPGSVGSLLVRSQDAAYLAWNLAAVSPWMATEDLPNPSRKANAPPLVVVIAREGFRAPNKVATVMAASHRHLKEIIDLKAAVCRKDPRAHQRDELGMAIRRWDGHGGFWTLQVLNALLVDAMKNLHSWPSTEMPSRGQSQTSGDPPSSIQEVGNEAQTYEAFIDGWQLFLDHLVELDVYEAPAMKRLLDGRSLAQALGARPGKWTGKALDICMAWQLRNPGEMDPKGAVDEVRKRRAELGIPGVD